MVMRLIRGNVKYIHLSMRPYRKSRVGMWTSRDQQVDPGKHRNRLKGGCDFRLLKRLGCCLNASRCYLKGQFASGNYERFVIYELPHRADSNDMNCEESPLGRTFSLFSSINQKQYDFRTNRSKQVDSKFLNTFRHISRSMVRQTKKRKHFHLDWTNRR
jgi:hypothetical protein